MEMKDKLKRKDFWMSVVIFTIIFTIATVLFIMTFLYDFDYDKYRAAQPFSNNDTYFYAYLILRNFIIGFVVFLFTFKPEGKS